MSAFHLSFFEEVFICSFFVNRFVASESSFPPYDYSSLVVDINRMFAYMIAVVLLLHCGCYSCYYNCAGIVEATCTVVVAVAVAVELVFAAVTSVVEGQVIQQDSSSSCWLLLVTAIASVAWLIHAISSWYKP